MNNCKCGGIHNIEELFDTTIKAQKREIQRLNNIIKQKEHLMKQIIEYIENSLKDTKTDERLILQVVLARLKVELKEGK